MSHIRFTVSASKELKLENNARNQVELYMAGDTPTASEWA